MLLYDTLSVRAKISLNRKGGFLIVGYLSGLIVYVNLVCFPEELVLIWL